MGGKTTAERQQALRERRAALGLHRFELWLHPSEWPIVKRYVEQLAKRRKHK